MCCWDEWVEQALSTLESMKVLRSLRPIHYHPPSEQEVEEDVDPNAGFEVFDGIRQWDRASVEIQIADSTFQRWLQDVPSSGGDDDELIQVPDTKVAPFRKLLLFSGNDYLGLSSHPTVAKAAANAVQEHGMGPRGSALICGYTSYHRLLESCLAESKNKEDCLLCPTGFSANMSFMTVVGYVASLSTVNETPSEEVGVAIFSDALNHASIIDGIRLAERQGRLHVFIYRHCDMAHLNELLSNCPAKKKVVVTDSLFSMDGDFAPMLQLSKLRKKHNFLLVVDDAHGTLVCGKNGGGVPEEFNCASDVDICIGTLSKAVGCHGGFIACSKRWKQLIQSRGRAFIFSTCTPIPIAAAAHAAMVVGKKETWRRKAIWKRVQDFRTLTGIPIASPIISLIVGSEEQALQASRHMLKCGFHITAIRPPTVPANLCRLRITLSAAHTRNDIRKLTSALSQCISLTTSTSKL
ncbi:hypothetical protein OSB04_008022 [Centaurea solstitialis]|uniref:Aminotransferase class I/classII large domain-containing protein n=1 Tax=Centaurea solstitialis TaxID=347529 RepID=A0AA38WJ35_9ASTR|nr:hypothetical protein OSB04_008022 [Centaurea solstitialis]